MKKLVVLLLLMVGFFLWDWNQFLDSPVFVTQSVLVVEKGSGLNDFQDKLLTSNKAFFSAVYYPIYIRLNAPSLKYGPHTINAGVKFTDAVTVLSQDPDDIKIRLPEGERLEVFADLLSSVGLSSRDELINCFKDCVIDGYQRLLDGQSGYEGELFPDTYTFPPNATAKLIVTTLLNNFRNKFDPLAKTYSSFLRQYSARDVVIVASLLEREAKTLGDKQIIAGILYERLKIGMRLDVDATVSYVKGDWRSPLTYKDLAIDSPYNTRKNKGLPSGPICNPGAESLEAALSPKSLGYLYYLTGNNGAMYYARTLEEHNINKAKYL